MNATTALPLEYSFKLFAKTLGLGSVPTATLFAALVSSVALKIFFTLRAQHRIPIQEVNQESKTPNNPLTQAKNLENKALEICEELKKQFDLTKNKEHDIIKTIDTIETLITSLLLQMDKIRSIELDPQSRNEISSILLSLEKHKTSALQQLQQIRNNLHTGTTTTPASNIASTTMPLGLYQRKPSKTDSLMGGRNLQQSVRSPQADYETIKIKYNEFVAIHKKIMSAKKQYKEHYKKNNIEELSKLKETFTTMSKNLSTLHDQIIILINDYEKKYTTKEKKETTEIIFGFLEDINKLKQRIEHSITNPFHLIDEFKPTSGNKTETSGKRNRVHFSSDDPICP